MLLPLLTLTDVADTATAVKLFESKKERLSGILEERTKNVVLRRAPGP